MLGANSGSVEYTQVKLRDEARIYIGRKSWNDFTFRWQPGRDLLAVLVSWTLVVAGLYTVTFVVGSDIWGGMAYFAIYAVLTAGVFGVGFPLYWMMVIRKRPLFDLGITARGLWISLGLQLVFAAIQYGGTQAKTGIPSFEKFAPLLALALCIGFLKRFSGGAGCCCAWRKPLASSLPFC